MEVATKNVWYKTYIKDFMIETKEDNETSSDWPDTAERCNHNGSWKSSTIAIVFVE